MPDNPFILEPFKSKEYFCDREQETEKIIRNITNGRDTTLISPRRLGKTGLILRVFEEIRERNLPYETIYADISDTLSLEEFIKVISEAVVAKLKKQRWITAFFKSIGSVRPLLGLDPITGSPQVSLKIVRAIDEFQQIREYEGVNMEAILRKHIQHMHNVRLIFCGSKKHTMTDMFTNAKNPFYESTSFCYLDKLPVPVYSSFIKSKFELAGKAIGDEVLDYILDWTRVHTYYTQRLCNEVFSISGNIVDMTIVLKASQAILDSERERFREIRRLLTRAQWKMLGAIAKEGNVTQITSSTFLSKYGISSGPTALRNIRALIDKELVLANTDEKTTSYSVYNVFLSRFLAME